MLINVQLTHLYFIIFVCLGSVYISVTEVILGHTGWKREWVWNKERQVTQAGGRGVGGWVVARPGSRLVTGGVRSKTDAVSLFTVWILGRPHLKASYNTVQRLSQFDGSSKCGPLFGVAAHILRFFMRSKMVTSHAVDRHFRRPGRQKLWPKGKCGNIWWHNQEMLQRLDIPIKQKLTRP